MIPVLFAEDETTFTSQGIGALTEAISCQVTEERNGIFELQMTYPIDGHLYSELAKSRIILASHEYHKINEPFRIYKISRPLNGIVTIYAEHISYQLNFIPVSIFTADSAVHTLQALEEHAIEDNPFTLYTNINKNRRFHLPYPMSIRYAIGGWEGSIMDNYGGEIEASMYDFKLLSARGQDRGFVIRYGVNLIDVKQDESIQSTVTGIYPYYYMSGDMTEDGQEVLVELPEKIIDSEFADRYPFRRTAAHDFTERFDHVPTVEELREVAETYIQYDYIGQPTVNMDVKFEQLSQSVEYEELAQYETVQLCDTLTVRFEKLGIDSKAKVTRIIWDTLRDRYISITMGDIRTNLNSVLRNISDTVDSKIKAATGGTGNFLNAAVNRVTELLMGIVGGYKLEEGGNTYYMDKATKAAAVRVLRINNAGIGISNTGFDGPYTTAFTATDVVTQILTAGEINANRIVTGIIQDALGNFYVDLETGRIQMRDASFIGGNIEMLASSQNDSHFKSIYDLNHTGMHYQYITDNTPAMTRSIVKYLSFTPPQYDAAYYRYDGVVFASGELDADGEIIPSEGSESTFYSDGEVVYYDDNTGAMRMWLSKTQGLRFYNANGQLTKSYPAT